jgi:hypothetical protein
VRAAPFIFCGFLVSGVTDLELLSHGHPLFAASACAGQQQVVVMVVVVVVT